jgi:hypothetical protein
MKKRRNDERLNEFLLLFYIKHVNKIIIQINDFNISKKYLAIGCIIRINEDDVKVYLFCL